MSLSRPANFPLLKLPFLCIECVVRSWRDIFDIISFALTSKRARQIVKHLKIPLNGIQLFVSYQKWIRLGCAYKSWGFKDKNKPIQFYDAHRNLRRHPLVLHKDSAPLYTSKTDFSLKSYTDGNEIPAVKMAMEFLNEVFMCSQGKNPCTDPRHQAILPPSYNCSRKSLPDLLILGPQKTGSTALGSFLSLHPNVSQNVPVPGSFEEVQFFGGQNYLKGVQWYMSNFPNSTSSTTVIYEKSATYFDNPAAPKQAAALIPRAKLIVILQNPSQRAYSWYQHLLAHKDPTVISSGSSLLSILSTNSTTSPMWKIRQRCISGGKYVQHLDKWLEHYSLQQIYFVDADELRNEPAKVLTSITKWLDLPYFPFETHIRFSPSKGFHCRLIDGKTLCLGGSKGRKYDEMDPETREKLDEIFEMDNSALYKFLKKMRLKIPDWLQEAVRGRA